MGIFALECQVVALLEDIDPFFLLRHEVVDNLDKILLPTLPITSGSDTEVVEPKLVEQLAIIFDHAEQGVGVDVKLILVRKIFEQLYHHRRLECKILDLGKVFTEQLGSFLIATKQEKLGYLVLILHEAVVVIG